MSGIRRTVAILISLLLLHITLAGAVRPAAEAEKVTQEVLSHAIIIDTHADTPQMVLDEAYDLANPNSPYMISIPKLRAGHVGAEFFSIWVDVDWPKQDLIHRALDLIDVVHEQAARHADTLGLAATAEDIDRLHREGKVAILMGIEGGHIIEGDLRALNTFYRLGARYMTLTHTKDDEIGDSSGDKPRWNGLTPFGRQVVQQMNRLGMMVDISHVSDRTFYDTLQATRAPLIASHSSCRAICDVPRNMTDDMIRALAKNGGVMGINFYSGFIDSAYRDAHKQIEKQENAAIDAARQRAASKGRRLSYPEQVAIQRKFDAHMPVPSYTRIADHIDHVVKLVGVDHLGLGSDFDGIESAPRGMEDVSKLPDLVRELARRGYSAEDLEKMLGGNLLRVMRQVEQVSRDMQNVK